MSKFQTFFSVAMGLNIFILLEAALPLNTIILLSHIVHTTGSIHEFVLVKKGMLMSD